MTGRRPPSREEWPGVTERARTALAARWHLRGRYGHWRAVCPLHGDRDRNLAVRIEDGELYLRCHSHGCDRLDILVALGVTWQSGRPESGSRANAAPPPNRAERSSTKAAKMKSRANSAREFWCAALADGAPVRAYLASRGVWPPARPLPGAVRWLPREREPFATNGWPDDAVGAAVYGFAVGCKLTAVQLECLTADGTARQWAMDDGNPKRKTLGRPRGAAFRIPGAGETVHVAEGPIDALAIRTWRGATAWASAGAGLLAALAPHLAAGPVMIDEHGDAPGRQHAGSLWEALCEAGTTARIVSCPDGMDPADCLAADWLERRGLLEADGLPRPAAVAQTWTHLRHPTKDRA